MTKYKETVEKYTEALSKLNLRYNTHISLKSGTEIYYTCNACGHEGKTTSALVSTGRVGQCANCREIELVNKYTNILKDKFNSTYLGRYTKESKSYLEFKCNTCGETHAVKLSSVKNNQICPKCIENEEVRKLQEFKDLLKSKGKMILKCNKVNEAEIVHLYCGYKSKVNSENKNNDTCVHCYKDLATTKTNYNEPKQLEEFDKLLKYVLDLVNEIKKQNIDLSKISEYTNNTGLVQDTIEYIEGWYNSFKGINNKYPKGNLIGVLSYNIWYGKVWREAVPVLEKLLGIEN